MDFVEWLITSAPRVRHVIHYMDRTTGGNGDLVKGYTKIILDKEQPFLVQKAEPPKGGTWSEEAKERLKQKRKPIEDTELETRLKARLERIKQQENSHGNS